MNPITFVFLLTVWGADAPTVNVEDHSLSASDCTREMEYYNETNPSWTDGIPSCEINVGWDFEPFDEWAICLDDACTNPLILPMCPTEDSDNCVWDARTQGNGEGSSFYMLNGQYHSLDLMD